MWIGRLDSLNLVWFWPFLRNFNFLKIQSKFWAILSCLKGYQAAFWVSRMAWNVQLVPKNYLNWILVQLKSKYWAKLGPKLMKMVKNNHGWLGWIDIIFLQVACFTCIYTYLHNIYNLSNRTFLVDHFSSMKCYEICPAC